MTSSSKPRRQRPLIRTQVISTQWLTPRMVRVVVGGEGLRSYVHNDFTDRYVKLVFLRPGVTYPEPLDLTLMRALPPEERPIARTYTVRSYDPERRRLAFDFVVHADHGDEGVAAAWASRAEPGDELLFAGPGPGGAYTPDPGADWHLFAGDESAIPAIGAALEQLAAGVPAYVFLEVENAAEEQELPTDAKVEFSWFHRSTSPRPPG
ncbi:MAG TPA: siderophore-interacting protein, partial [Actinopolymorphaceae bacterium]